MILLSRYARSAAAMMQLISIDASLPTNEDNQPMFVGALLPRSQTPQQRPLSPTSVRPWAEDCACYPRFTGLFFARRDSVSTSHDEECEGLEQSVREQMATIRHSIQAMQPPTRFAAPTPQSAGGPPAKRARFATDADGGGPGYFALLVTSRRRMFYCLSQCFPS
jgi:hypothetical protein